jgi:hypothetical protein
LNAVRVIEAHESPKVIARDQYHMTELFSAKGMSTLIRHCPNIHPITRKSTDDPFASRWEVHIDEKGGGMVSTSYAQLVDDSDELGNVDKFEPPAAWPGFDMQVSYSVVICEDPAMPQRQQRSRRTTRTPTMGGASAPPTAMDVARTWLLDFENLDDKIDRIYTGRISLSLIDIGKLCASRHDLNKTIINGVIIPECQSYTLDDFKAFGSCARGLRELDAHHPSAPFDPEIGSIEIPQLRELVDVIRTDFADLRRLTVDLQCSYSIPGPVLYLDHEIPIAPCGEPSNLEAITLRLKGTPLVAGPQSLPDFAIARNLAVLCNPLCQLAVICSTSQYQYRDHPIYHIAGIMCWLRRYAACDV